MINRRKSLSANISVQGPKNDPPMIVQEKVLSLIQSWADAFYNQPDMSPVVQIYRDLKSKGIEFPMTDLDAMAPIHTPRKVSYSMRLLLFNVRDVRISIIFYVLIRKLVIFE